jgi:hypothetical protein
MFNRPYIAAALLVALAVPPTAPAFADGETLITHAKALAGNVTPGDTAGYPVTISIPGIFELASNLFVAADKIGIQVTSPYVTIDLNGFLMQGSNVAWYGIAGGVDSVIITNGIIAQFEFDGIIGTGNRWVVERMQVLDNGRHGIALELPGQRHRVHDSTVAGNDATGIRCTWCVISANVVTDNGGYGINSGGATVVENYIALNADYGLITGALGSGFAHNTVYANNGGFAVNQVLNTQALHPNICEGTAC